LIEGSLKIGAGKRKTAIHRSGEDNPEENRNGDAGHSTSELQKLNMKQPWAAGPDVGREQGRKKEKSPQLNPKKKRRTPKKRRKKGSDKDN